MSSDIETQIADDGVATLTLARAERRNALSIKMRDEITAQLDDWAADPAVRVVVLTGAGPTFCAGFDLNEFGQPDLAKRIKDNSRRYHLAVWHFPKPLVAAVNGPAMGGGMDLRCCATVESLPALRYSGIRRSSLALRRCSLRCSGSSGLASRASCA